jgi:hypothetical protein
VSIGKWLLIAVLLAGTAHQLWKAHERSVVERTLLPLQDSNGFVPVQTPAGTPPDTVLILAALNCPLAAAKRADAMAEQLSAMRIPNTRANHYAVSITSREQMPLLQQTSMVLGGEIPVVIVNGMAKANPTVDEVAAEFRRGN